MDSLFADVAGASVERHRICGTGSQARGAFKRDAVKRKFGPCLLQSTRRNEPLEHESKRLWNVGKKRTGTPKDKTGTPQSIGLLASPGISLKPDAIGV